MTSSKSLSRPRVVKKEPNATSGAVDKRAQLQCRHCEKRFTYPNELKKHLQRVHSSGATSPTDNAWRLVFRLRTLASESHRCDECEEAFDDYHALRNHKSHQHPQMKSCSWPGCTYTHRLHSQVDRHEEQAHHDEATIACSVVGCGAVLPYNRLAKHVADAHGEEPEVSKSDYVCLHCGAEKATRLKLKRHINCVHGEVKEARREKNYRCKENGCGKAFSTPGELGDHNNWHRGVKPYECGRCAKQFHARARYAVHLRKYHATSIGEANKSLLLLNTFLGGNNLKKRGGKRQDSGGPDYNREEDDEWEEISDDSEMEGEDFD